MWGKEGEKLTANLSLWVRRCGGQRACRASLSFPCTLRFWKTAHLPFHGAGCSTPTEGAGCGSEKGPKPWGQPPAAQLRSPACWQELAAPAETAGLDYRPPLFPLPGPGQRPSPGQRPFSLTGLPHPVFTCLCQALRKGNVRPMLTRSQSQGPKWSEAQPAKGLGPECHPGPFSVNLRKGRAFQRNLGRNVL